MAACPARRRLTNRAASSTFSPRRHGLHLFLFQFGELTDVELSSGQADQDAKPMRISQGVKDLRRRFKPILVRLSPHRVRLAVYLILHCSMEY